MQGSGIRVQGSGCMVLGLRLEGKGKGSHILGFRV